MADIWRDITNCSLIRKDDDFFLFGGDSIAVFRILARIDGYFGVNISVNEFFQMTTIKLMAQYIDYILT